MEGLNMPELAAQKQAEEDQKKANEEQRELYICSILTVDARERLNRIALVKPEKARQVGDSLIQGAMRGTFVGKIDEAKLVAMLEGGSLTARPPGAVNIVRKGCTIEDDSDEDLSDLY